MIMLDWSISYNCIVTYP